MDYALFAKDRSRVYFIELKTHGGSRRDAQDHYLATSELRSFSKRDRDIHRTIHVGAGRAGETGWRGRPTQCSPQTFHPPRLQPILNAKDEYVMV